MAALVDPALSLPAPEIQDLRGFRAGDLEALLQEETAEWLEALNWDFEKSADLVRKFVDMRALTGAALVNAKGVVGYAYYVLEDQKGLLGDVFVRRDFRTAALERQLMDRVMDEMLEIASVTRVESQLMMLTEPLAKPLSGARYFQMYPREYLSLKRSAGKKLVPRKSLTGVIFGQWVDAHQEKAATLIADSYQRHVDSSINDQYRSTGGARKFLANILQYPGCGVFHAGASLTVFERGSGELCGICLVSIVGPASGHITQICVSPKWQGSGLGYELMRRSIEMLWDAGCQSISLTVTSENRAALTLYRNLGFRLARRFAAYVWEGW